MSLLTMEQLVTVAEKTRRDEASSPCVDCKSEVALLPLRYAVITSEDKNTLEVLAPALPSNLGKDLPALEAGGVRYAVRAMRAGYVYAFVKRLGTWRCESAWHATGTGVFAPRSPYAPHRLYTKELGGLPHFGGWGLVFKAPEDIDEARLLFTPDALTERMVNMVRDVPELRDKLQSFDIRKIANSCSYAADVLDTTIFESTVAEYIADGKKALQSTLNEQLFSDPEFQYVPRLIASELQGTSSRARGCAVILHDSIGITQQLNSWRNDAVEGLQRYLQKTDGQKISNEHKVLVAWAFDDIKEQFEEGSAATEAQHYIDIERQRVSDARLVREYNWTLSRDEKSRLDQEAEPYLQNFETKIRADVQAKLKAGEYCKKFEEKYVNPPGDPLAALQVGEMKKVLEDFNAQSKKAEKLAELRAKPHESWLQSQQLLDALEFYDQQDQTNGWYFSGQTGLCIFGADGCKSTSKILQRWWQGQPKDPKNLALRSFGLNQKAILLEMERTLEVAKTFKPSLGEDIYNYTQKILEKFKNLADFYDKANGLYEEMEKAGNGGISGGVLAWYSSLGTQTLRHAPTGLEYIAYGTITRSLIAAGVGRNAVNMRVEELKALGRSVDPVQARQQIKYNANFALATELVDAKYSEFHKVRATGWLLLLESGLLFFKASQGAKDEREKTELAAAALAASAAGIEVLAAGTELVLRHYRPSSVTGVGATVFLGRLKLWGGGMATIGAALILQYDFSDGEKAFNEKKPFLATSYFLRFAVGGAMAAGQFSLAFAAAEPMFKILAERAIRTRFSWTINFFASLSSFLGREAVLLLIRRILMQSTLLVFFITVYIAVFDDDDLQKWCQRTLYRGPKFKKYSPYKDVAEELACLYGALRAVL